MGARVLIVEDSEFMQLMLCDILKSPEFEIVAVAKNGIEAIEKYMEFKPDIVTLDVNMPHLNGLEVLDGLYKFDPGAKIVVVSSKGRTGDVEVEALKKGAKGVITKPFKPSHTLGIIRKICAGGKEGFTLLEVLIAVMLFTIGVVIIIGLFSAALVGSVDPENTGIAMTLAQKRIEEIRNLDFDAGIISESKAAVPGFTGFQRSLDVTTPYTELKQVTVSVYWSYKGGETTTSLVTYISKN